MNWQWQDYINNLKSGTASGAYYQEADRILRAAEASWNEVVRRIQEELALRDTAAPTLATVIDQREISVVDAMHILQEKHPFEQWRLEMWRAVEAQDWAAAYVNSYQGFVVMQNATNPTILVCAQPLVSVFCIKSIQQFRQNRLA